MLPGGILSGGHFVPQFSGGILSRGHFVRGHFVQGALCPGFRDDDVDDDDSMTMITTQVDVSSHSAVPAQSLLQFLLHANLFLCVIFLLLGRPVR